MNVWAIAIGLIAGGIYVAFALWLERRTRTK